MLNATIQAMGVLKQVKLFDWLTIFVVFSLAPPQRMWVLHQLRQLMTVGVGKALNVSQLLVHSPSSSDLSPEQLTVLNPSVSAGSGLMTFSHARVYNCILPRALQLHFQISGPKGHSSGMSAESTPWNSASAVWVRRFHCSWRQAPDAQRLLQGDITK